VRVKRALTPAFGVGVDIIEVARIGRLVHDKRFLKRVFTESEVAYCRSHRNSAQHFAVRFAAKEAVWKALNGREDFRRRARHAGHRDISVVNAPSGQPHVVLKGLLSFWRGRVVVSLSHTRSQAVAVAMVL
jgi:holo-[acyl-carrier protein] synthase